MSLAGVVFFFKGCTRKKKEVEIPQFSGPTLFKQQAEYCAFLMLSQWTSYLLFSTSPFSLALSFHLIFPKRCLCSCMRNHNVTSLGAAFVACVCMCARRCTGVVVCVHFEVLLGAVRGLSSTLGFNGSPHHCSASSYLLPCRRAVASSRWLIRKAGNVSQIPNHPYTHTYRHTAVCGSMFLSGPVAAGPIRGKYV